MQNTYPRVFEPFTVRGMTMRNRIVMAPMGTNFAKQNGELSEDHIRYYEQRARGGVGLIMAENMDIDYPQGSNGTTQLRIDRDNFMPRLYELCEAVHRQGAKIGVQINHAGAATMESRIGCQPISASNIPSKAGGEVPRPMTVEEIEHVVKKFGEAAKRAQACGFDAVEIHAGHSYLLSQFLSPLTNDRTDEFGGSPENRARFTTMVVKEVRRQVGPMFPVFIRISADELMEGGNTLDDTIEYLQYFVDDVDVIDVSAGLAGAIQKQIDVDYLPDGWRSFMARRVKDAYGKPCITVGNIRDPQVAEDILERGDADLIGIGRGLIADPAWAAKAKAGRVEDIRKCISCNIGCAGHRIGLNQPMRCTVNPDLFHNDDYKKRRVLKPCNVVVVGGGTAGLEAACTAAEVGCTTFLFEVKDHVGGLAATISHIPEKDRIMDFPAYLERRARRLHNLFILTSTPATIERVRGCNPDIIVNATGSNPLLPPIAGLRERINAADGNVVTALEMINRIDTYPEDMTGKRVVIIGGGATGLDIMGVFAPRGADVTVIERGPALGSGLDPVTKSDTADKLKKYDVRQMTKTSLEEVRDDCFVVTDEQGAQVEIPYDYGFVALGMRSNNPVLDEFESAFADDPVEIYNIGDSKRSRQIIHGTQEGRDILAVLERLEFL
jgi:2,4-dienoyl-CoA reductase-like NADH-dependent reductase (Old Yellow Enzyme family)/thioredoxin reductase